MRGRTTIALSAVLAGTLLTGVGTTSAAFSDTAMVEVGTVGAGELSLTVTTAEQVPVQLGRGKADFTVTRTGVGATVLRLSVVDAATSDACATLPAAKVTVSVPGDPNPVRTTLCELTAGSEDVVRFTGRLTSVTLTVEVIVPAEQSAAGTWDGLLHFELGQRGGGFSDVQDVAARVVVPGGG